MPEHHAALLGHDVLAYRRLYVVTDDDGAAAAPKATGALFAV